MFLVEKSPIDSAPSHVLSRNGNLNAFQSCVRSPDLEGWGPSPYHMPTWVLVACILCAAINTRWLCWLAFLRYRATAVVDFHVRLDCHKNMPAHTCTFRLFILAPSFQRIFSSLFGEFRGLPFAPDCFSCVCAMRFAASISVLDTDTSKFCMSWLRTSSFAARRQEQTRDPLAISPRRNAASKLHQSALSARTLFCCWCCRS